MLCLLNWLEWMMLRSGMHEGRVWPPQTTHIYTQPLTPLISILNQSPIHSPYTCQNNPCLHNLIALLPISVCPMTCLLLLLVYCLHVPDSLIGTTLNRLQDKLPKATHKSSNRLPMLTNCVSLHKEKHKKRLYVDIQPLYLFFISILRCFL